MERPGPLRTSALFLLMIVLSLSSGIHVYAKEAVPGRDSVEAQKHRLFLKAINDCFTQTPYFTVARVKDIQTDSVKTVCFLGKWLCGMSSTKERYFELSAKALEQIDYHQYPVSGFDKIAEKYHFDRWLRKLRKRGHISIYMKDGDHIKMAMLAHLFFERGYLPGLNNCLASYLYVYKDEKDWDR